MAYPKVHIVNSTNYTVKGTVKYAACSSDDFEIAPGETGRPEAGRLSAY